MITVNENGVRNINASLLSIDSDIKASNKGLLAKIEALQDTVDGMSGGEINVTPGSTYDINITGNAATATHATTADTISQVAGTLTLSKTSTKTDETTADTSFNGSASVSNKIYSPDQSVNKSDNVTFKSVNYSEENVVTYSMASSVTMPSTDVIYKGIKLTGALTADATLTLYFNSTTLVGRKSWHILNECTTLLFPEQTITITTNAGTSTTISVKKNQASYVTDIYVDSSGNVLPFASTRASSSDSLKNPLTISSTALSSATSYNGSSAVAIYSPSQLVNADSMPAHNSLKLTSGADVSPTYSTGDPLVIGQSTGQNLALDNNEIMSRNNNVTSTLALNADGGPVTFNSNASGKSDSYIDSKSTVIINPLNCSGANGYNEGLKINKSAAGYSTITLGCNNGSITGIQDGAWWIGCNNTSYGRKLYISHNSSISPGNTYFYADSSSSGTSGLVIPNVMATKFTGSLDGNATSADKVNNVLTLNVNGTTTSYDGSSAKTATIYTPDQAVNKASSPTFNTVTAALNGNASSASSVSATASDDSTATLVSGKMGTNDYFRVLVGGSQNAGYAEIATADDATEPIYVRQYSGVFSTLARTATLLDGSGNTSFPGTVSASSFSGNASSASHLLINGVTYNSNWYWNGQSGQPSWLWGSNDGTNMYVWNPSNFSVSYATSATSAVAATTAGTADKIRTSSPGSPANGDIWMV